LLLIFKHIKTSYSGLSLSVEYFPIPDEVKNIPGRQSKAGTEAVFTVFDIPALGFKSFYIKYLDNKK